MPVDNISTTVMTQVEGDAKDLKKRGVVRSSPVEAKRAGCACVFLYLAPR